MSHLKTLILAALVAGCSSVDAPNDPVVALYCDEGYVLNPDGSGCVPLPSLLVHGVVRDAVTGAFVLGAEVTVYPPGKSLTAGGNGYFALQGAPTTDSVIVTYEHPSYAPHSATFDQAELGVGMTVIDASATLTPAPGSTPVAGTLYAGDAPAAGATVVLHDTGLEHDVYVTTSGADGRFTFSAVAHGSYELRVPPFDEDGDGVTDFSYTALALGDIAITTTYNVSNLVVPLAPVARSLLYTNLIGLPLPFSGPLGVHADVLRLSAPGDDLVLHFGAGVEPASFLVTLTPFEAGNGGATGTGEPLPLVVTWSSSNTVATLDPASDLVADTRSDTQYELRIDSLVWSDGEVWVSPASSAAHLTFRFDVSSVPVLPESPTPDFYLANLTGPVQTVAAVTCDARVCWLLDADGYFFGGFADPVPGGPMVAGWNGGGGFQLSWSHEPGAASYWVYARLRSDYATGDNFSDWYALGRANVGSATSPTDPELGPVVFAGNVLGAAPGARNDWNDFDLTGGGPLAFGTELDVAITAVDSSGYESPLSAGAALTLADVVPASLRTATLDFAGTGVLAATSELGSRINKVVRLRFTEYLDALVAPELEWISGNIVAASAPTHVAWDVLEPLTPQNASDDVALGPVALRLRGACSPITCAASYNTIEPALSDDVVCVDDVALFATGDVVFVNAAGALVHGELALAGVDAASRRISFTTPVTAALDPAAGVFACALESSATAFVTTLTTAPAAASTTLDVADATSFHVGELVLLYDPVGNDLVRRTVTRVTTGPTETLGLDAAVGSGAFAAGTTRVLRAPGATEYALRPVTAPALRYDTLVASDPVRLDFTSSLASSSVMVGDLVLVDLDGVLVTIADRYFGTVTQVSMVPDAPSGGIDESDYHLELAAPAAGHAALPSGALVVHGVSLVYTLGDALRVANGDAGGAAPLVDTSGNLGLHPERDQLSACVGPVPPTCAGDVFVY